MIENRMSILDGNTVHPVWQQPYIYPYQTFPTAASQGWQCPCCKTVHAPTVSSCMCQKMNQPNVPNQGVGTYT